MSRPPARGAAPDRGRIGRVAGGGGRAEAPASRDRRRVGCLAPVHPRPRLQRRIMKSDILKRFIYVLAFSALLVTAVAAGDLRLPSFLPDYYGPAFSSKGRPLAFVTQRE